MNKQNKSKLNKLLSEWPHGTVYTTAWLKKQNYSHDLINLYRTNHWLQALSRGAVIKSGDSVDWLGGIYAIQEQLQLPIHPSATTALSLKGASHYLPLGRETVYLLGAPGSKLPAWFRNYEWDVELDFRTSSLFETKAQLGLEEYDCGTYSITISSLERAILELLALVPGVHTFEYAEQHMETLMSLRTKLLQKLLEDCSSVKVKRLFLCLAERLEMPWLTELKLSRIELGSGKRVLAESGKLNAKYGITVPGDWV